MDRRNGGDPLAPPRPPKLLPRVHRPRAPEPMIMSDINNQHSNINNNTSTTSTSTSTVNNNILQCTTNSNLNSSPIRNCNNNNTSNCNVAIIPTTTTTPTAQIDLEDYQIHHLTFLPQRPSSLSRTGSHVSSNSTTSTTSSSLTAANSFTRRRPPPPRPPGAAVPLLQISGSSNSSNNSASNNNNHFFSHFQSVTDVTPLQQQALPLSSVATQATSSPASPVTLAQPRPESERLANEYVDTPLRNAQQQLQLQHASRVQHPAGQHDFGQTTTHHLLLLPQRELRQQQQHQQHQQQQQQHSSRAAGTAGTANAALALGIDGTDGFLHSHPHHHHYNHQQHSNPHHINLNHLNSHHHHQLHGKSASTALATSAMATSPHVAGKLTAATTTAMSDRLGSFTTQSHSPPITKQPTNTSHHHQQAHGKFVKDLPALDNLLDLHNIATGISTPQGVVSAVDGASPLGTSILIGSMSLADGGNSLTSITCPRCGGCRCQECQRPRPLPQTWVCNKTCLCSAESVIDYASCLCCAKALFYHCARDNDMDGDDGSGTPCVDNPCSCGPYKRTQRWGWLGALSLLLPCLWFYWPMRGCVAICEKCYGRYAVRGCRCQHIGSTSSMQPIVHLGVNGSGGGLGSGVGGGPNSVGGGLQSGTKSLGHSGDCTAASRILRKGDLTPEKRLLDSSPEY